MMRNTRAGRTDDLAEVDDERHLLPDSLRERPLLQDAIPAYELHGVSA